VEHAWCHDVARDAAVRAAEDKRTEPLPTLGEAIAGMFPKSGSASSAVDHENKGDGMATDRVMLEDRITLEFSFDHRSNFRPKEWAATFLPGAVSQGISVRVVDEDREAADRVSREEGYRVLLEEVLTTRNERDAAIREREDLREQLESVACRAATAETALEAARVGGQGEAVAWVRRSKATGKITFVTFESPKLIWSDEDIVPLYERQPRGWLSEDEREIIAGIADDDEYTEESQNIAKGLLDRSSPPEVVLPMCIYEHGGDFWRGWMSCDGAYRKAIAAAGGAVEGVGSEWRTANRPRRSQASRRKGPPSTR